MLTNPAQPMGGTRIWFPRVQSTMDVAMGLGGSGAPHGTLVEAAEQTAGRGRQGRRWEAPQGSAFLGSWLLRAPSGVDVASLSPAVAAAVLSAVASLAPDAPVAYKWPNDVLIDGRKLAGILLTARGADGCTLVVAGTGVNVLPGSVPPRIPATCLAEWCGVTIPDVRDCLAIALDAVWKRVLVEGGLPERARDLLDSHMALRGEQVEVLLPNVAITGIATGLAPGGGLRLRSRDDHSEQVLHVGEIVRGPRGMPGAVGESAVYFDE